MVDDTMGNKHKAYTKMHWPKWMSKVKGCSGWRTIASPPPLSTRFCMPFNGNETNSMNSVCSQTKEKKRGRNDGESERKYTLHFMQCCYYIDIF